VNNYLLLIEKKTSQIYYTNYLGLARSLLAFGLLCTLLFNSNDVLFSTGLKNEVLVNFQNWNLFQFGILGKYFAIFVLVIVTAGFFPRLTCIPHWYISFCFSNSTNVIDGGDQITSIISLFLIPIFIFDKRTNHFNATLNKASFYKNVIFYNSFLLIRFQAVIIYFHAAVGKINTTEWLDGTAIYYWFSNSLFGMPSYLESILDLILKNPIGVVLLTWGVIFLELFIVFAIIQPVKSYKNLALALGIIFHFLIIIFHSLTSFFFPMTSLLILSLCSFENKFYYNYFQKVNSAFINRFKKVKNEIS
jgi:antimicrobial peptide system SdpB family protein